MGSQSLKQSALPHNPVESVYRAMRCVIKPLPVPNPLLTEASTSLRDHHAIQKEMKQRHPLNVGHTSHFTDTALSYAVEHAETLDEAPTVWPHLERQLHAMGILKKQVPGYEEAEPASKESPSVGKQRQSAYFNTKYPSRYVAESFWASIFHPVQYQDHQALRAYCRHSLQQFEQDRKS
jgi:hypothetical protein